MPTSTAEQPTTAERLYGLCAAAQAWLYQAAEYRRIAECMHPSTPTYQRCAAAVERCTTAANECLEQALALPLPTTTTR